MQEWQRREYVISTDRSRLNIDLSHNFLSTWAYCALSRTRETVECSIVNSLPFGYATFAYLADVFGLPELRGQGLPVWLMEVIGGRMERFASSPLEESRA